MKLGFDSKQIALKFKKALFPIAKHHMIIAFVFVVGILILAIIAVNMILSQPPDQQYILERQSESVKTNFDEITIEKVDTLRRANEKTVFELPEGRINPFYEGPLN